VITSLGTIFIVASMIVSSISLLFFEDSMTKDALGKHGLVKEMPFDIWKVVQKHLNFSGK